MSTEVLSQDETLVEEEFFDSYAFPLSEKFYFPDGKQWIEITAFNEGTKVRYEKATQRDFKINRRDDTALIRVDTAVQRHALILHGCKDWFVVQRDPKDGRWIKMQFSETNLKNWLLSTHAQLVEDLAAAIMRLNPWLGTGDETVEELEKQIAELTDRLEAKRKEEAGKI